MAGRMTGEVRKPIRMGVRPPVSMRKEPVGLTILEFGESQYGNFHEGYRPGDTFMRMKTKTAQGWKFAKPFLFVGTHNRPGCNADSDGDDSGIDVPIVNGMPSI